MVRRMVIDGRGRGLVCLADRRRGGRLGRAEVFTCRRGRRRHRDHRCLMTDDVQNLLLRGQQELLHQGRRGGRVVRMRAGVVVGDVGRGGDEDAAAVAGALVVNDGFAAH